MTACNVRNGLPLFQKENGKRKKAAGKRRFHTNLLPLPIRLPNFQLSELLKLRLLVRLRPLHLPPPPCDPACLDGVDWRLDGVDWRLRVDSESTLEITSTVDSTESSRLESTRVESTRQLESTQSTRVDSS